MKLWKFLKTFEKNISHNEHVLAELYVDGKIATSADMPYICDKVKDNRYMQEYKVTNWSVVPFAHAFDGISMARILIFVETENNEKEKENV